MKNRIKRSHKKAVNISISLSPTLYDFSLDRVGNKGFSTLSGYLQSLVMADVERSQILSAAR